MHKRIAKITRTFLGIEGHGVFTAMLDVDYGGSGQGIGGFVLNVPERVDGPRQWAFSDNDYAACFILGVLGACGVDAWEKLPGRTVFVLFDDDSFNATPRGLAPLPTEPGEQFLFTAWGFGTPDKVAR